MLNCLRPLLSYLVPASACQLGFIPSFIPEPSNRSVSKCASTLIESKTSVGRVRITLDAAYCAFPMLASSMPLKNRQSAVQSHRKYEYYDEFLIKQPQAAAGFICGFVMLSDAVWW